MGLSAVFQKAAVTAFKVADDIPKEVVYREIVDDGFDTKTETDFPATMLEESITENTKKNYSFAEKIIMDDVVGLIPTLLIETEPKVNGQIIRGYDDAKFEIIAVDKDPAGALYVLLLRKAGRQS